MLSMSAAFTIFIAAAATSTTTPSGAVTPSVVVVHDASSASTVDAARAAAAHLHASGKVSITLHAVPVSSTCARAPGCDARPDADALLLVTTSHSASPAPSEASTKSHSARNAQSEASTKSHSASNAQSEAGTTSHSASNAQSEASTTSHAIRLELLDERGVALAAEDVVVTESALLAATLAPALDRIIERGRPQPRAPSADDDAAATTSTASDSGNVVGWVLGGTAASCGAVCLSSIGLAFLSALASSRETQDTSDDVLDPGCSNACLAPVDALNSSCDGFSSSCNAFGNIGSSCGDGIGDIGGSCGDVGGSLGDSCGSIGSVGSCALAVPLPEEGVAFGAANVDERNIDAMNANAMRY